MEEYKYFMEGEIFKIAI